MELSHTGIPDVLHQLEAQGKITLRENGIEYQSNESLIFISWSEAASASQIAQIRTTTGVKSKGTED